MHELSSRRRWRLPANTGTAALGLCLCAGQLVATPAAHATVAAAPAIAPKVAAIAAAEANKPVTPKLSMGVAKRTIGWGTAVKVTAKVRDPKSGKAVSKGSVRLQAWRAGAYRTWQAKKVSAAGAVAFTSRPQITGKLRVQFTGGGVYRAVAVKGVKVVVKANGAKVIAEAKKHRGKPYRFGAAGPRSFDCSGFTMYVYRKAAGKKLPHKANAQQRYGTAVAKKKARPGDLIVVRSGSYGTHAGIYAGNGYMYASPRKGKNVGKQKIWSRNYVVRRLV